VKTGRKFIRKKNKKPETEINEIYLIGGFSIGVDLSAFT